MDHLALELKNVSKRFGEHPAVEGVDLQLAPGEVLTLVGPSGCGKTTVLRLIAGFERPDSGEVLLDGRSVANRTKFVPPEHRGVGMVFQDYALFPHLTVGDNVAFGLPRAQRDKRAEKVEFMLRLVGLDGRQDAYPQELSGGQRQRVALARALLPQPVLILLDEPLSSLDADLRLKMREELRVLLKGAKLSAVFVTHDQEEALYLGDRLAVMNQGRVEQVGTPEEIFSTPASDFVAVFMGKGDFLPGTSTPAGVQTEIGLIGPAVDAKPGAAVDLVLRADDVQFEADSAGDSIILARHYRGTTNLYRLRLPSGRLLHASASHTVRYRPGTRVRVWAEPGHALPWFARD
ncbi:MAG: ABC transporter ATP-binding protein [Anaerolineales bacterium]|nr:ABC transporter ATP-binding protein [Anaerolineales bacterium]MCW5856205.1 ABC transporter ATP-binding protein [Anaerolineales bacterium]